MNSSVTMLIRYAVVILAAKYGWSDDISEAAIGFGVTGVTILWALQANGYVDRLTKWFRK